MMRTTIIAILTLVFWACGEDEFDSYLTSYNMDDIIRVELHPNSPVLMADGKSKLTFQVRVYSETKGWEAVPYTENGTTVIRDSVFTDTVALKTDRIPQDQISIVASNGEKVEDNVFSTTSTEGELTFTCQVGNIKSEPCRVKLQRPQTEQFTPRTIPVVFHLLYNEQTAHVGEILNEKFVQEVLDRLNRVFAGTYAVGPTSVDTKVTFVPLEEHTVDSYYGPVVEKLKEKGINRVDVGTSNAFMYLANDASNSLVWDPSRVLNVWILEPGGYASYIDLTPDYVLENGTEIAGLNLTPVADDAAAIADSQENNYLFLDAGICLPIHELLPMKRNSNDETFEFLFGQFFGLFPTADSYSSPYNGTDTDFCSDTYVPSYEEIGVLKRTATVPGSGERPIYYKSYNIMDPYSAATGISYEQALRMRKVMENCPLRMMQQ